MKLIILAWFLGIGLTAALLFTGIDYVYEKAYFNKQTPEKQAEILKWKNHDEIFIEKVGRNLFRIKDDSSSSTHIHINVPDSVLIGRN